MAQYKLSNIHKVDYNRNAENSVNETAGIEQQYGASGIQRNTKLKPDSKLGLLRYKSAIVKREDSVNKTTESSSHASPVSPSKSQLGKKRIVGGTCQLASESTGGHLFNGSDIKQVSSCETSNTGNAKGVVNTKSRLVVHKSLSSKSFGRADQHVRRVGGTHVGIKDAVAVDKIEASLSDAGFNPCSPTKSRSLGSLICDKSIEHGRNSLDKTSSILKTPSKAKPPNSKASMSAKQPSRKSRDGASSKSSLTESSVSESDLEKLELNSPGDEMGSGLQQGNKSRKQSSPAAPRFKSSRKLEGFQMSSKLKVAACEDVNVSLAMNKHAILLDVTPNGDTPTKLGCSSVDKYEKVRTENFFGRGTNLSNGDDGICSR